MDKKIITDNRRINLINGIENALEDKDFNEWEHGFLEDVQKQLQLGNDLSRKQYEKLIDIIPEIV